MIRVVTIPITETAAISRPTMITGFILRLLLRLIYILSSRYKSFSMGIGPKLFFIIAYFRGIVLQNSTFYNLFTLFITCLFLPETLSVKSMSRGKLQFRKGPGFKE